MKRILVLDNYDSFTYNLVHLLRELPGTELTIVRNDKISVEEASRFPYIVLSPGPGVPKEAGIMPRLVHAAARSSRILGVCLGHQCIGEVFGGTLRNLTAPVHGKATACAVTDREDPLFRGLPERFDIGRYHSWVVEREGFPESLRVTAVDEGGEIMALRHRELPIWGVQFHPESVLTPLGPRLLANFLGAS
jgi:anthranilate synthase component II